MNSRRDKKYMTRNIIVNKTVHKKAKAKARNRKQRAYCGLGLSKKWFAEYEEQTCGLASSRSKMAFRLPQ